MTAATPRPPDLTRTREQVRGVAATDRRPAARAVFPLTFLDAALEAKLAQRFAAGLTDPGDFPRRTVLRRTVLPSAALAVLDAVALVAALAAGNTVLVVVAGVLLVIFALVAVGGWRFTTDDPLRLTAAERRTVDDARTWRSGQDWAAGAGGLVVAAADAATRICRTPFWRVGRLHDVQVRLDLARELDAIDAEARRSADAHELPEALVDRVAALTAYADQVDGYERRRAAAATGDPLQDFGTDEDEVVALLAYLNATAPR